MIKIEITGNSIAEVADKLLAIGSSLQTTPLPMSPVMPEVRDAAPAPAKAKKAPTAMKHVEPEAAEVAAAPEPQASAPAAPVEEPAPSTIADTPTAAPAPSAPEPLLSADALRDLVLSVVRVKGRDAMVSVLDTFGAAKASDVPPEQMPELVAALEALL